MTNIKKLGLSVLAVINAPAETVKIDRLFQRAGFPIQYRFRAEGTASNEVMDVLGLTSLDKAVTLCVVPRFAVHRALRALSDELGLYKPGHGIAFAIPLSGISSQAISRFEGFFSDEFKQQLENEVSNMVESCEYCLVMAAVDQGFSEEVMATAKKCGVTGGTVIHGRRLGVEEKMKFWGISVQSEKELIAIIVPRADKLTLMQTIGEKFGIQSKAHGLLFSMPVEGLAGIGQAPSL